MPPVPARSAMPRPLVAVVALGVAALAFAACASGGSGGGSGGGSNGVSIADFSYAPAALTVQAGTTVTWTNAGPSIHTVTADDGSFDSGTVSSGSTFSHTFATPGTFTYHCAIHDSMHGTITVTG